MIPYPYVLCNISDMKCDPANEGIQNFTPGMEDEQAVNGEVVNRHRHGPVCGKRNHKPYLAFCLGDCDQSCL